MNRSMKSSSKIGRFSSVAAVCLIALFVLATCGRASDADAPPASETPALAEEVAERADDEADELSAEETAALSEELQLEADERINDENAEAEADKLEKEIEDDIE